MRLILALITFLTTSLLANESAHFKWVRIATSSTYIDSTGVFLGPTGDLFTTGYFMGAADFHGSTLTNSGSHLGSFVAKYSSSGELDEAWGLVGTGDVHLVGIAIDRNGSTYMTGYFLDFFKTWRIPTQGIIVSRPNY